MELHNYILPILFLIGVTVTFSISLLANSKRSKMIQDNKLPLRNCPKDFLYKQKVWFVSFIWWLYFYYMLMILSFLSSMMILYLNAVGIETKEEVIVYSILAASATIFNFALSPKKHAIAFRKAAIALDLEICKYMYSNETDDATILNAVIDKGELFIDKAIDD